MQHYGLMKSNVSVGGGLLQHGITLVGSRHSPLPSTSLPLAIYEKKVKIRSNQLTPSIDAQDDPPRSCGVRYNRDCIPSEGCVVSAITNMTSRSLNPNLSSSAHYQALKFLIHFIGDVHQPLHTENEARGGNDLHVRFNNRNTNLHAIWDTDILEKHAGPGPKSAEKEDAQAWAETLFSDAASNPSLTLADDNDCLDVSEAENCALQWANEANSYICSYVLKDDVQGVEGKNLAGKYYEGAIPIVDYLVRKAGFRLGSWINGIAAQAAQTGEGIEEL